MAKLYKKAIILACWEAAFLEGKEGWVPLLKGCSIQHITRQGPRVSDLLKGLCRNLKPYYLASTT